MPRRSILAASIHAILLTTTFGRSEDAIPHKEGYLLHGGAEDDHGRRTFGDPWIFQNSGWKRLGEKPDTDPRDDHGIGWHRSGKKLVLLDGVAGARGMLVREATG